MNKTAFLLMCIGCVTSATAQRSITDTTFTVSNVEIVANKKQALQDKPVELLGMDVPLKFLPITVTRLDSKTMERKHITNMEDAVRFLPGVVMSSNQLGAFQRYSVRGTTDAVFAFDGIRDDRTLLNTVPFGDLSSVESIEVIKGPASVLSGYSVMGGVINIIRKKASAEFTANASVSYGSWDQKEATVGFGGKLFGPLNYRANMHYANGDGYRMVNADRFSGLFAIGMEVTKKGYLEANVSFNDDHYTTDIGGAPVMPGDMFATATGQPFATSGERNPMADYEIVYNDLANNKMRRRNVDVTLDYKHELTRWMSLHERFSYGHSNLDYTCVEKMSYRTSKDPIYDWYYIKNGAKTYVELDSLRSGDPLCFNPDSYSYTNTLELTGKFFTNILTHHYTAGWNYSFFDYTNYTGYKAGDVYGPGLNAMLPVRNPHYVRDWWDSKVSAASISRYQTNGFYLHDVIEVNEQWKGMVGLRYDNYRYKKATATIDDGRQHYDKENRTDWTSIKNNAVTYRAGLVYLPIPDVSVYASAASFFKPNNTTYNAGFIYLDKNGNEFNPDKSDGEVFKPEKGYQLELGARYELNRMLELNGSVFYIRKHNVVKTIGNKTIENNGAVEEKSVRAQVGREVSKGFDLDLTFRPVSTLEIVGGLGWSDRRTIASNLDWIPEDADWVTYNEDGSINLRATNVPRATFYTYADYTIPKGVLKNLSFHLSGTFTDRIYSDIKNDVYEPARYIIDAGIFYTVNQQVTLAFNAYNLLNKKYFEYTTRLAKPFHFMATVSYRL
ncbi:TonB-dependent receptor [uncultured Parabacteroides sp.]|uniref:TonB-dependent receptor n=1 Tax=uncultured Parabacteroides sp. TaxID=512312 RepID=UPI002803892B|nr:TonB-dependent receptor [uncultured Parabacteroides sp.]